MLAKRIIPCLDIKQGRVVKGTSFVGLRDAGDPVELASRYNEQSADELVFWISQLQRKTGERRLNWRHAWRVNFLFLSPLAEGFQPWKTFRF